jgi:hypothetical protein
MSRQAKRCAWCGGKLKGGNRSGGGVFCRGECDDAYTATWYSVALRAGRGSEFLNDAADLLVIAGVADTEAGEAAA